jgi:hypothetical protein
MGDVPNGRKFRAEGERGHSFFLGHVGPAGEELL